MKVTIEGAPEELFALFSGMQAQKEHTTDFKSDMQDLAEFLHATMGDTGRKI